MKEIPNLLPGSRLDGWIYNLGQKNPQKIQLVVTGERKLNDLNNTYEWADIAETPHGAIRHQIGQLYRRSNQLLGQIFELEAILRKDYPVHPVLSEGQFGKQYPNLPGYERVQDHSPATLKQLNDLARQQEHKYNEPN